MEDLWKLGCFLGVVVGGCGSAECDELPDVYTDFDFSNGAITDSNNKFTVENYGATVGGETLTFAGNTNTVGALKVNASGQHAVIRFKDYDVSNITNFYNSASGFTIEALYVNYAPNETNGIVSATHVAGLGLAESKGTPYFYVYGESPSVNTKSNTAASKTGLNHLVCTGRYDAETNKTYTAVYLNGVLVASGSCNGKLKVSTNTKIANAFSLGADIGVNGYGEEYFTTNFALVDLKFYDTALDADQAEIAYENAVEDFKNQ